MKKCFVVSILLLIILTACNGSATNNQGPKVWEAVQPEVLKLVKFPDTAQFCQYSDAVILEEDGKYRVLGEVKSNNALGVTVSNGFETIVTPVDGGYAVGEVVTYDNLTYKNRLNIFDQKIERIKKGEGFLTPDELDQKLSEQNLYISRMGILRKSELGFAARGDALQAIVTNRSDETILNCVIAFACWDSNNLPLRIQQPYITSAYNTPYIAEVHFQNINLRKGKTYGEENGYYISENMKVKTAKAIIVSYEGLNGVKWENPYYLDFIEAYEGKELK